MRDKKILMVWIEPTPYILDLIKAIEKIADFDLEIIFLKENLSQNWNLFLQKNQVILKSGVLKTIYQKILQKKYRIIFLAGWSNKITLLFLILAKLRGIPVAVDSDTPILPLTSLLRRAIKRMVYPILFKLPNLFLPAGIRQANYLKYYGVSDHKIILEKMTVDVIGIQESIRQLPFEFKTNLRNKLCIAENDFVFLFIGRLIERKGIKELLDAFSKINNSKAKLLIIGSGELKPDIEAAAELNNKIIYTGWLERNEIIKIYFISDVFVLPAHWEPWGLVINEAMAAGLPVIVSDQVGCVDDLVMHEKTGLIIKNKSVNDLIFAFHYFLNNPEKYKEISKNSLSLISNHTIEDSARQIGKAFECLQPHAIISSNANTNAET